MTKRSKTTIALILTVAVASGIGAQQKAAGAASQLPHGTTSVSCHASFITQHCSLVVQPGTVADAEAVARNYSGTGTGIVAGIAGFMCFPAGPAAFICGLAAAWRAEVFLNALRDAAAARRCVRVSWDQLYGVPVPMNFNVVPYGSGPTWTWVFHPETLDWQKVWADPTSCKMGGLPPGVV